MLAPFDFQLHINLQLQDLVWKLSSMTAGVLELLQLHSGNWAATGDDVKHCVYSGSPRCHCLIPFYSFSQHNTMFEILFLIRQRNDEKIVIFFIFTSSLLDIRAMRCVVKKKRKLLRSLIGCVNKQENLAERLIAFYNYWMEDVLKATWDRTEDVRFEMMTCIVVLCWNITTKLRCLWNL